MVTHVAPDPESIKAYGHRDKEQNMTDAYVFRQP